MAMKISKTQINRLSVDMSCGCQMYSEFKDVTCKEPYDRDPDSPADMNWPVRHFTPCEKHAKDPSVGMLEFILGERLSEAMEDSQKAPVMPQHMHRIPQEIEEGDAGGIVGTGGVAQTVARVQKPIAVRKRTAPPEMKTLQRSPQQLASAGAAPKHVQAAAEVQIDEAPEDEAITPHIDDLMDILDPKESGLLDEGSIDDE